MKMKKESKLWLWVGDEWLKKVSKDQKGEAELSFVAWSFNFDLRKEGGKGLNLPTLRLIWT